jgi:WD40 repeat protein
MKTRFEDRIPGLLPPPDAAGGTPGVSTVEHSRDGWKLTRRSLMGLLAAGAFGRPSRAPRAPACSSGAAICSPGAFAHEILLDSLSFFPDGKTLVSAGKDSYVKFWTVPEGALFRSIATDAVPSQVAVSPDGNFIAVAMDGGHLELWPAGGGTTRGLVGHTDNVNGVAFTPDSSRLVSVSLDRTTKVWSVADAKLLNSFADTAGAMAQVAVPRSAQGGVPDAQGRAQSAQGRPPTSQLPLPSRFLVTSGSQLYLRSFSTGKTLRTAAGQAFAISPDGQFLAAHDQLRLYMYAFPGMAPLVSVVEKRNATSLSFSADGKLLAIAYTDAPARLYSAPDLTLKHEMEANEGPCLSAAMDPQNSYLAVASGKSIRLYLLPSGSRVQVCFMDTAASSPASTCAQYFTGGLVYTIACGGPIPAGIACTCDCVPGNCPCVYDTGCSCVSDSACGCVNDTGCSCDSDTGCSCVGDTGCSCVGDVGCSCDGDYGCGCVDDTGCGCDGNYGCGCDGDYGCGCDGDSGCGCDGDGG